MSESLEKLMSDIIKVPIDRITDDLSMDKVESWDSLKHMDLIASIEREYAIELTFDEIVNMRSVDGIKKVLHTRNVKA